MKRIDKNKAITPSIRSRLLNRIILPLILTVMTATANGQTVIAITKIVAHPSLEQAKLGVLDELKAGGYEQGKNLKIIDENAQGSIATATAIAKKLVSIKPDAIIPISTASAQTVMNAAKDTEIPIVFSSVTDPVSAGLVKDLSVPTANMTGAIDYPPLKEEVALIQALLPQAKTLGMLYNAGEANSAQTVKLFKEVVGKKLVVIESVAQNTNQVSQALNRLVGKVDVVYIPSDNTIFSAMANVVKISRANKLPVLTSDPDSVKLGVLACAGYTQYKVGRQAGKMLVKMLKGERNLRIERPEHYEIYANKKTADQIGIKIPAEVLGVKVELVK